MIMGQLWIKDKCNRFLVKCSNQRKAHPSEKAKLIRKANLKTNHLKSQLFSLVLAEFMVENRKLRILRNVLTQI